MKQKLRKLLVVSLCMILVSSMMLFLLAGCGKDPDPGKTDKPKTVMPKILSDLIDLGVDSADYAPNAVTYSADAKSTARAKLLTKQLSEKAKHNYIDTDGDEVVDTNYYDGEYHWVVEGEETSTFTRIFLFADLDELIDRMAAAALSVDKMTALVDYITRTEPAGTAIIYTHGQGSAIRDYEELDDLYDLYDENDSDENYINLQQKRRKVMHEVFGIFGDDAAAASRTAIEELTYAQQIVGKIMIQDYIDRTGQAAPGFVEFFKGKDASGALLAGNGGFFDYDSLSYFLSFNKSVGIAGTTPLFAETNGKYKVDPANRKTMMTLFGYYYQYEKAEFAVFTDDEYTEYLDMGTKDFFTTNADALKYRDYDRRHYEQGYRYSASFYDKYYNAHFGFQSYQEEFDIQVYDIASQINYESSYAYDMKTGCKEGLASTLKISDVNWVYTGVDNNVTAYNKAAKEYYGDLSDEDRDNDGNMDAKIAKVHLEIEQLKSQHYTVTHKEIEGTDLSKALIYQIYSYSGNYKRVILANRKNNVIYKEEKDRLDQTDTVLIAEKNDQIGRNDVMLTNHEYFFMLSFDITGQINSANGYNWKTVAEEMESTLNPTWEGKNYHTYDAYHADHLTTGPFVDKAFEDQLIHKIDNGGNGANDDSEYDTNWVISRIMSNHEDIFRYANNQIKVEYKEATTDQLGAYELHNSYLTKATPPQQAIPLFTYSNQMQVNPADYTATSTYKGYSASDAGKFVKRPATYGRSKEVYYDNDEAIDLARFENGTWGKSYLPKNGTTSNFVVYQYEKTENNIKYQYTLIFEGWYIDQNLIYPAKFTKSTGYKGESFDYNVRLYPSYKVIKQAK